jgi:hypothetical protein
MASVSRSISGRRFSSFSLKALHHPTNLPDPQADVPAHSVVQAWEPLVRVYQMGPKNGALLGSLPRLQNDGRYSQGRK